MKDQRDRTKSVVARALLGTINGYQMAISPLLGQHCRYYPSCSRYMCESVEIHGASKGAWLGVARILRCHPFHEGGIDPVPGSVDQQSGATSGEEHQQLQGSMSQ